MKNKEVKVSPVSGDVKVVEALKKGPLKVEKMADIMGHDYVSKMCWYLGKCGFVLELTKEKGKLAIVAMKKEGKLLERTRGLNKVAPKAKPAAKKTAPKKTAAKAPAKPAAAKKVEMRPASTAPVRGPGGRFVKKVDMKPAPATNVVAFPKENEFHGGVDKDFDSTSIHDVLNSF